MLYCWDKTLKAFEVLCEDCVSANEQSYLNPICLSLYLISVTQFTLKRQPCLLNSLFLKLLLSMGNVIILNINIFSTRTQAGGCFL